MDEPSDEMEVVVDMQGGDIEDDAEMLEADAGEPQIIGHDLVCIEALDPPPIPEKRKRRPKKASARPSQFQASNVASELTSDKARQKRPEATKVLTRSMRKKSTQ